MSGAMRKIGEYLGLLEDSGFDDYDADYDSPQRAVLSALLAAHPRMVDADELVTRLPEIPRVREAMALGGYEPDGRGPAETRKFVREEYDRYAEMVKVANVPRE